MCGVVGWRRKLERREKQGQRQYLEAMETLEKRTNDQLLEKTNWYKGDKKRKRENQESKFKYNPPPTKRRKRVQQRVCKKKDNSKGINTKPHQKVKAVMFLPFTKHF